MKMNKQLYYFLPAYCFVVRGKDMNIIYNSQRGEITFIPDNVVNLIKIFETKNIEEIKFIFHEQKNKLDDIITFLTDRNVLCTRSKDDFFPKISIEHYSPEHIKHLVVEYSNKYDFCKISSLINTLLVKFAEIRYIIDTPFNVQEISKHMSSLYKTTIKSVQIVIDYKYSKDLFSMSNLTEFNIVCRIILFNSPFNRSEVWGQKNIQFVKYAYPYIKYSNNDYNKNYIFDLRYFMLSHTYNPYYYKRLCVNEDGDFMNCLKCEKHFGNINNDNVLDVVNKKEFRELWYAAYDKVKDIRDNPMRYNMYLTNCLRKEKDGLYTIL